MRNSSIAQGAFAGALLISLAGVRGDEPPAAGREAIPDEEPLADRKEEARRLAERIKATRHPHIGADAILKMRRLGKAGLAAWLDLFPMKTVPPGGIELSSGKAPETLTSKEPFEIEVVATNRTAEPLWISTYEAWMPAGKRVPDDADRKRRRGGPAVNVMKTEKREKVVKTMFSWPYPKGVDDALIMMSDFHDLVLLAPGESVTCRIGCQAPEAPGRYRLRVEYGTRGGDSAKWLDAVARLKEKARGLLEGSAPVTFKQNDQIIRGFPDIAWCETACGVIEVGKQGGEEPHEKR